MKAALRTGGKKAKKAAEKTEKGGGSPSGALCKIHNDAREAVNPPERVRGRILLVGVPNCGKSTVFCALTGARAHIGNWAGVTVTCKEGRMRGARGVSLIDLPGICGAEPTREEEEVTARVVAGGDYDLILQIGDATAPLRSLCLTRHLLTYGKDMILVWNRMDLCREEEGLSSDALSRETGIPVFGVSAATGAGMRALKDAVTERLRGCPERAKTGKKNGAEPEKQAILHKTIPPKARRDWATRVLAAARSNGGTAGESSVGYTQSERYTANKKQTGYRISRVEKILCAQWTAFLIMPPILAALLTVTTGLFGICGAWTDAVGERCVTAVTGWLSGVGVIPFITAFLTEGLLRGALTALSFLPPLYFFYLMTAILEDSGYLARIAFLCDRPLCRIGLSGGAVMPFLLSAGCGVTGVGSCKTLSGAEKRGCGGFCTWVPCHAKLPLIAMVLSYCGIPATAVFLVYFLCVAGAVTGAALTARGRGDFCMELPRPTLPPVRIVLRSAAWRAGDFLRRAGGLLALSGAAVWLFSHVGTGTGHLAVCEMPDSLLAALGARLAPVFAPLGFAGWESATATLAALLAKENAVVTLSMLGGTGVLGGRAAAMAFCLFNLFCPPCVAAVAAMRQELGRRAWLYLGVQTVVAAAITGIGWNLCRLAGW